jgi:hypothetical protein
MNERIDQCILNCLTTERGSLPMFRSFGLQAIDQPGRLKRSQIQGQLSKFYPDIDDLTVTQNGETYRINIRGRYYEAK